MVAISVDPPEESAKTSSLIDGRIRLLYDSDMSVIRDYDMVMLGGGMASMGYVIVDGEGNIVERTVDPLFGYNVPKMLEALQRI